MGGIYSGFSPPTESAAVALVYALLVEILVIRELKFADLVPIVRPFPCWAR
ncbi:MAG: hypothetical protein R3E95_19480 [Thiolinea sp.]